MIKAPAIGLEVSSAFNGDYYPAGKIVAVSKTLKKVTTDQGIVFIRRKNTAFWARVGGTFAMVLGKRDERNPSF